MVTEYPRAFNNLAMDAEMIPFPREEATPPVTKIYLVLDIGQQLKNKGKRKIRISAIRIFVIRIFVIRIFVIREGLHHPAFDGQYLRCNLLDGFVGNRDHRPLVFGKNIRRIIQLSFDKFKCGIFPGIPAKILLTNGPK